MAISITVQNDDFNHHDEYERLRSNLNCGAIVTFTGLVREFRGSEPLVLEHYPGMTEKALEKIATEAQSRWPLEHITVIHRVGSLSPNDQIVFVGVASAHRKAAFEGCHFIIDLLKTQAPFWKKEGNNWVNEKSSDVADAAQWQ